MSPLNNYTVIMLVCACDCRAVLDRLMMGRFKLSVYFYSIHALTVVTEHLKSSIDFISVITTIITSCHSVTDTAVIAILVQFVVKNIWPESRHGDPIPDCKLWSWWYSPAIKTNQCDKCDLMAWLYFLTDKLVILGWVGVQMFCDIFTVQYRHSCINQAPGNGVVEPKD